MPLIIVAATTSVALRAVSQKENSAPPRASIVYSAESAFAQGHYQLYLDTWPKGSKRAIQPNAVGPYRPGDDVRFPIFSPDGRNILFTGNRVSSAGKRTEAVDDIVGLDLWVLDIEKNSARPLTTDGAGYLFPSWSPNGKYICAVSLEGRYDERPMADQHPVSNLYVWDVFSLKRRKLAKNAFVPTWSSNSRRIFYEGVIGDDVPAFLSVDRDGGKPTPFMRLESEAYLGGWSRDGKFLVYSDRWPQQDVYAVSVLRRGQNEPHRYLKLQLPSIGGKWSPDGRMIALIESIPHQPNGEYKSKLLVLDLRSGKATELWSALGEVTILRWSKDSNWVIASRYKTLSPSSLQELVAASVGMTKKVVVLKSLAQRSNGFDWHPTSR